MDDTTLLLLLVPILLLELGMKVAALVHLSRAERTKGPKALWAALIVLTTGLGWILYFLVGRDEG